jgi:hypothetical protein
VTVIEEWPPCVIYIGRVAREIPDAEQCSTT